MEIVILDAPLRYDGLQLSTSFVDRHAAGRDAAILFVGEADVPLEHMVDLEDVEAGEAIWSPQMAHAVVEHRDLPLPEAVWRQRMLVRLAADWLAQRSGVHVDVRGDDLFVGDGKLSVSIATTSARSSLIHLGVNVDTEGTPVKTSGLRDLRVAPREFLRALARRYADELASVRHAVSKVRPVR